MRWWNQTSAVSESGNDTESTLSRFDARGDANDVSLTSSKVYFTSAELTGTPVENRLGDLWSIFEIVEHLVDDLLALERQRQWGKENICVSRRGQHDGAAHASIPRTRAENENR